MSLEKRYGILVNDDEWDLLYRSVIFRKDSVEAITGEEPKDLTELSKDLLSIRNKGYVKTSNENEVTEDDMLDRVCKDCA